MVEDQGRLIETRLWTIGSHAEHVRAMLSEMKVWMSSHAVDVDTSQTTELVLAEVLNNIVEHAYAEKRGEISLSLSLFQSSVRADLSDQGKSMPSGPPTNTPAFELSSELEDLPEGGFGWGLIRILCTEIKYQSDGSENRTMLTIDRNLKQTGAMENH